jgi:hypothetical protein
VFFLWLIILTSVLITCLGKTISAADLLIITVSLPCALATASNKTFVKSQTVCVELVLHGIAIRASAALVLELHSEIMGILSCFASAIALCSRL